MSQGLLSLIQQDDKQQRRLGRVLKHTAMGVVLFFFTLALAAGGWLSSSLPSKSGNLALSGIETSVEIVRDARGIPTITAGSSRDAMFALGYVHAQDRLFQMDLRRRLGAGRLAEIMGASALPTDKWMRTLGLYHLASASFGFQSDAFQTALIAYADGVNAYLDARRGALPLEFSILRYGPDPWQPADTLVLGKLMQLELSGNFRRELLKAHLIKTLPSEEIRDLFPQHPAPNSAALSHLSALHQQLQVDQILAAIPREVGPLYASNSWIVDGRHTASGKPLLANDPHLRFAAPGTWYLCRIEAPGMSQTGATIAGAPLVVLGHNRHIAWGFTATIADVEDLFVEQPDPADDRRYRVAEGSEPFEFRSETIKVRSGPTATVAVRSTRHGPVISDTIGTSALSDTGHILALAATFLTSEDRSMEAIWRVGQAADWTSFTSALTLFRGPQQTVTYANTNGDIGYYAPGAIPIRRSGDGTLPVPGWSGDFDWTGLIPFDALPHALNPPSGTFATANQKIAPDNYPYVITYDWAPPIRAERIKNLIDAIPRHSVDTFSLIMADTFSASAAAVLPRLLGVKASSDMAKRSLQLLAGWDYRMDHGRPEPLIFAAWLAELNRLTLASRLGKQFNEYQGLHPIRIDAILARLSALDAAAALNTVLSRLAAQHGPDPGTWRWGDVHRANFANPVFRNFTFLNDVTNPSIPTSGGNDTINVGTSFLASAAFPFAHVEGAEFRAIYDLADLDKSVFMIAPGQSGNVASGNFRDLLRPWRDFEWFTWPKREGGERLKLTPMRPSAHR